MDLNQLAVFVRVIDAGSFTKAALFLKQPKSRVSRRIATLERDLGVALFYRSTRHIRPTEAALALYKECRDSVYTLESASRTAREHSQTVTGVLKITAAEDMGTQLLGPIIAEIISKYPNLIVDVKFSNDYVDLIRENVDLAIRIGELKDTTLRVRKIGNVSSILVASPEYLRNSPRIEGISDLPKHPTLDFTYGETHENIWRLKAPEKKLEKIQIIPCCRASNPRILVDLACVGKGIALVPAFLCTHLIQKGILKRILSTYSEPAGPVSFVWPSQKQTSPKIRTFVEIGLRHLAPYFN